MVNEKKICPDCLGEINLQENVYANESNWIRVNHSVWKCSKCGIELIEIL